MSPNTPMNIQMNMNQKKKTIIDQMTSPKDQFITFPLLPHRRPVPGPYRSHANASGRHAVRVKTAAVSPA
jgi:hypothetical protein